MKRYWSYLISISHQTRILPLSDFFMPWSVKGDLANFILSQESLNKAFEGVSKTQYSAASGISA